MATVGNRPFFTPNQISGCQLWLDAADPNGNGTAIANGSSVSTWRDKSGNGRNATGFVGTGTYSTTGLNSRQTIQITPTGNMASPVPAGTFSTSITLFVVFQKTGSNNTFDTLVTRTVGNKPAPLDYLTYSSNTAARLYGNGTGFRSLDNTNTVTRNTSPTILSVSIESSSIVWTESVNGTVVTYTINGYSEGGGAYGDTGTFVYIGTRADNATKMTGNISEIIAYNSVFTTAQRQQVEGYLAWKWGLQWALPTSHPYKSSPIPPLLNPLPYTDWTPTQISNCSLWLDAADTSSFSLSGTTVTQWRDKSGNTNNPTLVNSPSYVTGQYPYVATRNANQYFTVPSAVYANTAGQSVSLFILYNDTKTTGSNFTALCGTVNAANTFIQVLFRPDAFSYSFGGTTLTALNTTNTVLYCISFSYGIANTTVRINGSPVTLPSPPSLSPSGILTFAGYTTGNDIANINFNEIVSIRTALSVSQVQQVEGYLAWKWGLQGNLPSDHPYKNSPVPLVLTAPTIAPRVLQNLTTTFIPSQVSGCSVWFDGADPNGNGIVPANGTNISVWVDKSGNGTNATRAANFPTFANVSLNGLGTIRFAGASGTSIYLDTPAFDFGTSQRSFFAVIQNTGPASGAASGPHWFYPRAGNGTNSLSFAGWNGINVQGTQGLLSYTLAKNTFLIISMQFGITSAVGEAFTNGTSVGTFTKTSGGASFANATSGYRLGWITDEANANYNFDGNMAEIILFNRGVPNSQRQQIEGYLAWKWGLQGSLSANHPYKFGPPYNATTFTAPSRSLGVLGQWRPIQISGCALWLDATDRSSFSLSGTTVTQWRDKSGLGNNANPFTSNPTLVANVQNRLPGLLFSGGQALSAGAIATGTNFSLFTAVRYTGGSVSMGFWKVQYSSYLQITKGVNVRARMAATGSATPTFDTGPTLDENPHVVSAVVFSDTVSASGYVIGGIDGTNTQLTTSGGPNTTSHNGSSPFTIGALIENNTAYFFMTGYVHEIVFYRSTLTTAQQQQVEGYLAWKWGLQANLPATHPFKLWPPPP